MMFPKIIPLHRINSIINQILLAKKNRTDKNYDRLVALFKELKHELVAYEIQKIKNYTSQLKEELLTKQIQLSKLTLDTNKIIESKNIELEKFNREFENEL